MAYDTATGTAVVFSVHGGTWTWNGTTWTEQHPAASPSARRNPAMGYDAATSNVVLFGGIRPRCCAPPDRDTWTWR